MQTKITDQPTEFIIPEEYSPSYEWTTKPDKIIDNDAIIQLNSIQMDRGAEANYKSALDFLRLNRYKQALALFENAYHVGHPYAIIRLHWLYSGATGVMLVDANEQSKYESPSKEIITWLEYKASIQGGNDQEAQFNLGWCYQNALGVEANRARAAECYWVAAEQGHRDAQFQFGFCCLVGFGIKGNIKGAIVYYGKAADQNDMYAHYRLSQLYANPSFGVLDKDKAAFHREVTQKGNHPRLREQTTSKPIEVSSSTATPATTTAIISPPEEVPEATNNFDEILSLQIMLEQTESQLQEKMEENHRQEEQFEKKLAQQKEQFEREIAKQKEQFEQEIKQLKQKLSLEEKASQEKDLKIKQLTLQVRQLKEDVQGLNDELQDTSIDKAKAEEELQFSRLSNSSLPKSSSSSASYLSVFMPRSDNKAQLKNESNTDQNELMAALVRGSIDLVRVLESEGQSLLTANEKSLKHWEQVDKVAKIVESKINKTDLSDLLKAAMSANLPEVMRLLEKSLILSLGTGTVTDLSNQTFQNITVLQCAALASDGPMCEAIASFVSPYNQSIQLNALFQNPKHYNSVGIYDCTELVLATEAFANNCSNFDQQQCCEAWEKVVREQLLCPAWLVKAWTEGGDHVAWVRKYMQNDIKRSHPIEWWFVRGSGSMWGCIRGSFKDYIKATASDAKGNNKFRLLDDAESVSNLCLSNSNIIGQLLEKAELKSGINKVSVGGLMQ